MATDIDAVLMTAFGGPEKQEDVIPYLTRVTGGRVPEQRLQAVAHHYALFGGKSPVKEITFQQAEALEEVLKERKQPLPVYVGMRHWHPLLPDTLQAMHDDGVRAAIVVIMSLFESAASWDQYKTDMIKATREAGVDIHLVYVPPAYDHPGFIRAMAQRIETCFEKMSPSDRQSTSLVFSAHSIPLSDPHVEQYARQIKTAAENVARALGHEQWTIAYQSRSGRPQDPWLEPDIDKRLTDLAGNGVKNVVVAPIGFVCDNMEVLYDLSTQARETAQQAGMNFYLARTVGAAPSYIEALADLVIKNIPS